MGKGKACVFCAIAAGAIPAHVVLDEEQVLAFLDHRPLFHGHCLVIPRTHHETLADLPDALLAPFFGAVRTLSEAVPRGMEAQGAFVALNNRVSQSVPHLHAHVVPRTPGDGLRGFFWPRRRYEGEAAMIETRDRIRSALSHRAR